MTQSAHTLSGSRIIEGDRLGAYSAGRPKKCPICGTKFSASTIWAYKLPNPRNHSEKQYFCSYGHFRQAQRQYEALKKDRHEKYIVRISGKKKAK